MSEFRRPFDELGEVEGVLTSAWNGFDHFHTFWADFSVFSDHYPIIGSLRYERTDLRTDEPSYKDAFTHVKWSQVS